jgi:hypothetical protein
MAPKAKHLEKRVKEIVDKKFDVDVGKLMKSDEKTLRKLYDEREIEPEEEEKKTEAD